MTQLEVYKIFQTQFPQYICHIEDWFPNGKNTIRVRLKSGSDFVFTYNNSNDWCFESLDSYIRKMKGGHKMNVGLHDDIDEDK